jgi:hypothetical protein
MRNISFQLTQPQILARTKTVTRRLNWTGLKAGTLLQGVDYRPVANRKPCQRPGCGLGKSHHHVTTGVAHVWIPDPAGTLLLDGEPHREIVCEGFMTDPPRPSASAPDGLAPLRTVTLRDPDTGDLREFEIVWPR